MGETREYFFTPREYMKDGDKIIKSPPLINTSFQEMASLGWCLTVTARYVRGYNYTRLRYNFQDPDKQGWPYLIFKFWEKGCHIDLTRFQASPDAVLQKDRAGLLAILHKKDLEPSWSKAPAFNLPMTQPQKLETSPVDYMMVQESEYDYLVRTNTEKLAKLRRSQQETRNDSGEIPDSSKRMVG